MKTLRTVLTILLLCSISLAVAADGDSLARILHTLKGEERLDAYQKIVFARDWYSGTDSTLALCNQWAAEAAAQGNVRHEEMARIRKLVVLFNIEDWQRLIDEATIQQAWMEKHGCWDSYYKVWRDIIESHSYLHHPQTALREAKSLQAHAIKHNNLLGRALAYQQMGIIYSDLDHKEAAKAFERCIRLLEMTEGSVSANELLGAYFYLCQEYDVMKEYKQELTVCDQWKAHMDKMMRSKDEDLAPLDIQILEYHLWNASALIGLKRYSEAAVHLAQADVLNEAVDDQYLLYQTQVHHAQLALAQGDLVTALEYSDQYADAMERDGWDVAQRLRGNILFRNGKYKEAAELYRGMYEELDSTFTKDVRLQLDEFNTLFQLDELRMNGQLERSRFITGIIAIIMLVMLFFIYFRYRAAQHLREAHDQLLAAHRQLEQTNKRLTLANERAEELSHMRSEFIKNISHEIRTPLNVLSGFTQIITTPGMSLPDDQIQTMRKGITENTNRIAQLVNKMIELSSVSSQKVISCDDTTTASKIAAQAAADANVYDAEHIDFNLQTDQNAELLTLKTNLRAATRALALLLGNALKFTKDGRVTLTVSQEQTAAGTMATFVVEDTGIGVPAAEAEHIFEEFVQLDEYADGTGIGLTVARSLARRLGGDIVFDSAYTEGSRFVMTLPTTRETPQENTVTN